jgi:hypothetical protein
LTMFHNKLILKASPKALCSAAESLSFCFSPFPFMRQAIHSKNGNLLPQ